MEKYIEKIKKIKHVLAIEVKDKDLLITTDIPDGKLQFSWKIIQEVYDTDFTNHINQIIVL